MQDKSNFNPLFHEAVHLDTHTVSVLSTVHALCRWLPPVILLLNVLVPFAHSWKELLKTFQQLPENPGIGEALPGPLSTPCDESAKFLTCKNLRPPFQNT